MTHDEVLHFKALTLAWFHQTRRKVPKGFAPGSPTVGRVFRSMIRTYQTAHGLKRTGELDTATQKALTPVDPRAVKAAKTMLYLHWCVEQHFRFTYSQARPIGDPSPPDLYALPRGGRKRDCSGNGKDGTHAGGFAQTDSFAFESGFGNTDSILAYAQAYGKIRPIDQLRQADYVIFESPGHLITVTGPHATDPAGARLFASDGHQGAPEYVTLAAEAATHGAYWGVAVD